MLSSGISPYHQFMKSNQLSWQYPERFFLRRGSHGNPWANNLIRFHVFLALEVFHGGERCIVEALSPRLFDYSI